MAVVTSTFSIYDYGYNTSYNGATFTASGNSGSTTAYLSAASGPINVGDSVTFYYTSSGFPGDQPAVYEGYYLNGTVEDPLIYDNGAYYLLGQSSVGSSYTIVQAPDTQLTCYISGTLIRTTCGDVAVEALQVGDLVVTASGAHRPIRWLGHRDTDCSRHPEPRKVWPVRVRAGALGAGLPYADLWLSPGHALCLQALDADEVLIPVRCLVQGEAVMQVERDSVTYWHVELDSHDILVANGVPAESYLDTGNRCAFDNAPGVVELHRDFAARSADGFCRPLVESGPLLSAARLKLFGAAKPVARTSSPVHMIADGTVLHGMIGDDQAVFVVPAGTCDLRLVSSSFEAQAPDVRTLGIIVGSLTIEAVGQPSRTVAMDDPGLFAGFYEIETCDAGIWRWTDGEAHFAPSLWADIDGAFILRIGGIFPVVRNAELARMAA